MFVWCFGWIIIKLDEFLTKRKINCVYLFLIHIESFTNIYMKTSKCIIGNQKRGTRVCKCFKAGASLTGKVLYYLCCHLHSMYVVWFLRWLINNYSCVGFVTIYAHFTITNYNLSNNMNLNVCVWKRMF